MIGSGSAGSPDATKQFYCEKIANRDSENGYLWQAYQHDDTTHYYLGKNIAPATQNGGLPHWEKYESFHKDSFIEYVKQYIYPVGSVYMSATLTKSPATVLGFGSWVVIPSGHALATPGDGLALGKTVRDNVGPHQHHFNDVWWNGAAEDWGDRWSVRNLYLRTKTTWGGPNGVTRGKRFGLNMWRRTS